MTESNRKKNKIFEEVKRHWPIITGLIALWVTILLLLIISLNMNQGNFVYGLDDAYIHMAMAKNFALHGVWGVTQYSFSSSSSSLLYTLIISFIYSITGVNDLTPFILNIILSSITIVLVYHILKTFKIKPIYNLIILLSVIFLTPLPYLVFIGMEHVLQIILALAFLYLSIQILTNENPKPSNYYLLLILTVLFALVRYESLILIFIVSILFFVKRKFTYSISIIAVAMIPIIIYGVISIHNGWSFLPNSLILKSYLTNSTTTTNSLDISQTINHLIPNSFSSRISDLLAVIFALISLSLAVFRFRAEKTIWDPSTLWLSIVGIMIFLELIFITNDWNVRYTSYLVVLGLVSITIGLSKYLPSELSFKFNKKSIGKYLIAIVLVILILSPFAIKSYYLLVTPQATNNIYEQQYQMGLFLKDYYQNDSVAVNDIGAVNYYANINCLDLVGLSSNDAAKGHETNTFNMTQLSNQHDIRIAIIYDDWWTGQIPSNWIKVGEWTTPGKNVILGGKTVSFYATSPQYETELIQNLRAFSPKLPSNIQQNGIYMNN